MRTLVAVAGLLLAAPVPITQALAQPEITPKRDYAAVYRVEGAPMMGNEMRVAYQASTRLQRIEGGPMGMTMLLDAPRGSMTMIDTNSRSYFEMTGGSSRPPWADTQKYRFERAGTDRVANTPCTVWRMLEGNERRGTACATDDGITLRAEWQAQGQAGKIEATSFTLGTQPPENFRVPAGYQKMDMPMMPPGMGGPPRRQ
jgi:hypothetical protein